MRRSTGIKQDIATFRAAGLSPAHAERIAATRAQGSFAMILLAAGCVVILAAVGVVSANLSPGETVEIAQAPSAPVAPAAAPNAQVDFAAPIPALASPQDDPAEIVTATLPADIPCRSKLAPLLAATRVYFAPSSAELDEFSEGVLRSVGRQVAQCDAIRVQIAGHSDTNGSDVTNLALSWERAEAVALSLEAAGIDTTAFDVVGFGAHQPYTQGSDSDDALNRRVELRLLDPVRTQP